jgi:hypothetical protein
MTDNNAKAEDLLVQAEETYKAAHQSDDTAKKGRG